MPSSSRMLMAATRLMEAPAKVASVRSVGIFLRQHQDIWFPTEKTLLCLSSCRHNHHLCSGCQTRT